LARKRTTTPRIPDDARARRSLEALRAAFLELLLAKPLEQVSIKEICDRAGLSYPTFYRRFASKEELLADIAAGEVRTLMALGSGAMARRHGGGSTEAMCRYIAEHRTLWKALLTGGAADAMRQEFIRSARAIAETGPRANPWLPIDLAVPFVSSGMFEIFAWWLNQPEDYPVGKVVRIFDALIVDTTARKRAIELD